LRRLQADHHQEAVLDRTVAVEVQALPLGRLDRIAELDAHRGFVEDADKDLLVLGDAFGDRQVLVLEADLALDHPDLLQRDPAFARGIGPVDDSVLKDGMAGVHARIDHGDQGPLAQRAAVCPLPKFGQLDVLDRDEQRIETQLALFRQFRGCRIRNRSETTRRPISAPGTRGTSGRRSSRPAGHDQEWDIVPDAQVRVVDNLATRLLDQIRRLASIFDLDQQASVRGSPPAVPCHRTRRASDPLAAPENTASSSAAASIRDEKLVMEIPLKTVVFFQKGGRAVQDRAGDRKAASIYPMLPGPRN
jgi:hypothetical protein